MQRPVLGVRANPAALEKVAARATDRPVDPAIKERTLASVIAEGWMADAMSSAFDFAKSTR